MITLSLQGQLQDTWTTICIEGEREADIANVLAALLTRLDFEIRIEGVRLDEYDWEEEDGG